MTIEERLDALEDKMAEYDVLIGKLIKLARMSRSGRLGLTVLGIE